MTGLGGGAPRHREKTAAPWRAHRDAHRSAVRAESGASAYVLENSFTSGAWHLDVRGDERITPVFAPDPLAVARQIMDRLRALEHRTGRAHVVCGLLPFDCAQPSSLLISDDAVFTPRRRGDGGVVSRHTSETASIPDAPHYREMVARAVRSIEADTVKKVVLARSADLPLPPGTDLDAFGAALAERLASANPRADIYRMRDAAEGLWVGASPEVVADVREGRLLTHPLAGSMPGDVPVELAGAELGSSAKNQREHAHVVQHIENALRPLSESIDVPDRPSMFATDSMWHLGTRITAHLHEGVSALEAALALHPTPAVNGTPQAAAKALIDELEATPRGMYAGLAGWTDSSGQGRWSLVLRGARLEPGRMRLYAGAGIVDGSEPAAEHDETAAKFRTVLRAVEGML